MPNTTKIQELNDQFRRTLAGGRTVMTRGIATRDDLPVIIEKVRTFDAFDEGNDPHSEHDFGAFEAGKDTVYWKLDYYDISMSGGSPDPADPKVTTRVLTVMLAEDY